MKQSGFQFANPSIVSLRFVENEKFENNENKNIDLRLQISSQQSEVGENEAVVRLDIKLGDETEVYPFLLEISIMAEFKWDESMEKDLIEKLLEQNAPSLLVSYSRPIISTVTNASHFPVYNLPFINFLDNDK